MTIEIIPQGKRVFFLLADCALEEYSQYSLYRTLSILGPPPNSFGIRGNGHPGIFYFHRARRADGSEQPGTGYAIFIEGEVNWRYTKVEKYEGSEFPGKIALKLESEDDLSQLRYHCTQKEFERTPNYWEALRFLIEASLPHLPQPRGGYPNWKEIALACADDIFFKGERDDFFITVGEGADRVRGLRAYVRGTSTYWEPRGDRSNIELLAQLDVAFPLARLTKEDEDFSRFKTQLDSLVQLIKRFYDPKRKVFFNGFPRKGADSRAYTNVGPSAFEDTWYYMENLIKVLELVKLTGDEQLRSSAGEALDYAVNLTRRLHYHYPLFCVVEDAQAVGSGTNYSVLGMYAYALLLGYELFERPGYLEEASKAIVTLYELQKPSPLEIIYHEPQQLAYTAAAAHRLGAIKGEAAFFEMRDDFLRAQLRMMYWGGETAGMFQACAGILYPAPKENVESILPWLEFLGETPLPLKQIINLQRIGNIRFISGSEPGPNIPWENLPTREFDYQGIGKELYGSGEILWMAVIERVLEGTGP